ncbi:hypothetical protein [Qipengyuania sp. ASV99]|uniref:hypothetical protein n=1 Tax=Qipengyuania sp. ASV99 TaxID=3399681 RepID=UPI003A4C7D31
MNRTILLCGAAICLIGFGALLADYVRLRSEIAHGTQIDPIENQYQETETSPSQHAPVLGKSTEMHEVDKEEAEPPVQPPPGFNEGFEQHLVSYYTGAAQPLTLTADQRYMRTRLGEAYKAPIDYGGSLTVAQIGCGTGCRIVYALDKSTGRVLDFPLGGEQNPYLWLRYQADSSLIWATWEEAYPAEGCIAQPLKLGSRGFVALAGPSSISCQLAEETM